MGIMASAALCSILENGLVRISANTTSAPDLQVQTNTRTLNNVQVLSIKELIALVGPLFLRNLNHHLCVAFYKIRLHVFRLIDHFDIFEPLQNFFPQYA